MQTLLLSFAVRPAAQIQSFVHAHSRAKTTRKHWQGQLNHVLFVAWSLPGTNKLLGLPHIGRQVLKVTYISVFLQIQQPCGLYSPETHHTMSSLQGRQAGHPNTHHTWPPQHSPLPFFSETKLKSGIITSAVGWLERSHLCWWKCTRTFVGNI